MLDAYAWSEKQGGGFRSAHGADPPALLLDAVLYFTREVNARMQYEMEQNREDGGG